MHHKKVKILLVKVAASLEKGNQKATYLIDRKVGSPAHFIGISAVRKMKLRIK
jgi:hypothetical protein